ncbi:hypothetical protein C9374_001916 [Naegleria lovaniensis]|uniref:Uncharacterized protein n=1 Tax=Naegleria lovaniensis TaxID=51637 RepID=A0AA88GR44_NAELO|nr:uncharacterized protein C9374_001916 [Naegleria lovaniensis]KAG2386881.1 hypothetical protein C9374_001916 [Naegleria lovaniensis]
MNQSDFMKPQQNHASSTSTSSSFGERSTPNDNGSPTNVLPVRRRKIAKHKKAELANRLPQLRTITQANENSHAMEDTDVIEITPIVIASSQESTTSDLNSEKKKKKALKKRTPVVEKETKETKQKKRKVSRQKMYENVAKTLRNSLVVQEGMLEYVENVPPLPDKIDVNKYRNKNLLALDVGSSFSKASRIHILRGKSNSCQTSHLKFGTHKENSFPTRIFYSKSLHQFNMKPPTLKTENSNDWFELENIKKIFMVQELYTIQLHGIDFNVAHVMYQLLKGLLTQLAYRSTTDEHNNKHSTLGSYSGLILTCPTNISEIVKLVYRNCALKAINEFVNPELTLEDIYIIEEFSLLKFFSDANNISTDPTLYVDIGHLTLDITVVEYDENGESKITYRNGEVGGMSILHNIIKSETGQDSFEIMKKMFDESTKVNSENEIESIAASPEPKIIEELQSCEEKIIEAMRSIVTPLCLIILQCSITKVHFAGAITSCQYFERLLDQLFSAKGIMETLERMKPYLKDQYKEIQG